MKKITIAIPTYNRLELVKKMAKSLFMTTDMQKVNVRIYDDCSTEYDVDTLIDIFPMAKSIHRHKINKGADYNMWYLYYDFLHTEDEILFNADSDIIFSNGWLDKALCFLEETDGCLSLFNTSNHMNLSIGKNLIEKYDVGAAGVIFKRYVLEIIMTRFSENDIAHFDYQWCDCLKINGVKIYATKSSLIQHIGFSGANSGIISFDYGDGFLVDSIFSGQAINDSVENYYKKIGHNNFMKKSLEYCIGYLVLWPFRLPKKILNKCRNLVANYE